LQLNIRHNYIMHSYFICSLCRRFGVAVFEWYLYFG